MTPDENEDATPGPQTGVYPVDPAKAAAAKAADDARKAVIPAPAPGDEPASRDD